MSLLEQIKFDQVSNKNIVFKYPSEQLRLGSQLIVGQGQEVIFVKGGELCDVFQPGTHTIKSANLPFLNKIINFPFGGDTPFTAEVWFIDTTLKRGIKWGTKQPIQMIDIKYGFPVSIRSFGEWGFRIFDSNSFLKQVIGNKSIANANLIDEYFASEILQKLSHSIASYLDDNNLSFFHAASKLNQISELTKQNIISDFEKFGIEIINFNIESISIPKEDMQKLQGFSAEAAEARQFENVNISQAYTTVKTLKALDKAMETGGNVGQLLSTGLGIGAGFGAGMPLGQQMASQLNIQPTTTQNDNDPMTKLKKLKELFDNGLITEDEYSQKKKIILDTL